MSIQAISLSNLGNANPDLTSLVQAGKGFLKDDPQSGSIIKILSENGFKEKIEQGTQKGHTYNILHAAPSLDFTLVDSWTEEGVDEEGLPKTQTKKTYQFFQIKDESKAAAATEITSPATKGIAPVTSNDQKPNTPTVDLKKEMTSAAPAPEVTPATTEPKAPVENSWLRSRLGIRIIDDNATNKDTAAPQKVATPVDSAPETTKVEPVMSQPVTEKVEPLQPQPLPAKPETQETPVVKVEEPVAVAPVEKLAEPVAPIVTKKTEEAIAPTQPKEVAPAEKTAFAVKEAAVQKKELSTLDLLKKRFGGESKNIPIQAVPLQGKSESSIPLAMMSSETSSPILAGRELEDRKLKFLETLFGAKMEGTLLQEWSKAKNIPARPFLYPTEYYWGSDSSGKPVERSLENYPEASKKLRNTLINVASKMTSPNINSETMKVGDMVDEALKNNIV